MTTNTAVRLGTPPISPETTMAKGVLIERGDQAEAQAFVQAEERLASPQADTIAVVLPTETPARRIGQ